MRKLHTRTWVAIAVTLIVVSSNIYVVIQKIALSSLLIGVAILLLLECVKLFLILKRFSRSNVKNIGGAILAVEFATFFLALVTLLFLALPYEPAKASLLLMFCADFFALRTASCLVLSSHNL